MQSEGTLDYNGLLVKFQRRFANNFSLLNSYTYGKAIDLNSDNDGERHADQRLRSASTTAGRRTTTSRTRSSSSWIYELPWATRQAATAAGSSAASCYLRGGLPLTVTQTQGVLSTGTGNRPNRICDGS